MAADLPWHLPIIAVAMGLAGCGQAGPDTEPGATADAPPLVSAAMTGATEPTEPTERPRMTLPVDPELPLDCNAPEAAVFVGRPADAEVRADLTAAVAPTTAIRWVGPGDATTEDYSPERLNVMLDVAGTILSAHCG